jgi:hypothetical protein
MRKRIAVKRSDLPSTVVLPGDPQADVLMPAGGYLHFKGTLANPREIEPFLLRLMNVLGDELSPAGLAYILQVPKEAVVDCPEDVAAAEAMEQALAEAAAGTLGQGQRMRCFNYDKHLQAKRATEEAQDTAFLAYLRWGRVEENEIINLMRSVDSLELSVRSASGIDNMRMGIRTVYDLVQKTPKDLLYVRNFGRKSLQEIEGVLASMNLRLGMVFPGWTKPAAQD